MKTKMGERKEKDSNEGSEEERFGKTERKKAR